MTDLDHASLDRVLPATSGPADWDDVMSRSRGHDVRRRRRLVVLAAVALLAVGTASAFGVRALILDKGFVGLPPEGATPSTPESGVLVESWDERAPDTGWSHYWLYADGRLIRTHQGNVPQGANPSFSGYLEQRLTPEGVEFMRSAPTWGLSTTHALAARFRELPASAWAEQKVRAYVPERYAVCYYAGWLIPELGSLSIEPSRILSALPAKAQELLSARQLGLRPGAIPATACSALTAAETRALAAVLENGGLEHDVAVGDYTQGYLVEIPGTAEKGHVSFEPMLPHGEWFCSPCG